MKNYTILRIYSVTPYQNKYQHFFIERNLELLPYEEAVHQYCKHGYMAPGQWSAYMKKLGNQSIDVLPDFFPLQKKWALENGLSAPSIKEEKWGLSLLFKQIEKIKPDVIFFYAGAWTLLSEGLRRELKSHYPFIKVITGLWGDPL